MTSKTHHWFIWIVLIAAIYSCRSGNSEPDAYGNFESVEIIVSAQVQGTLLKSDIREGSKVDSGQLLGLIDSTSAWLKKQQLLAQKGVIGSRLNNIDLQLKVQDEQRANLEKEVIRIEKLLKENAATEQQWDDITGKLRVLDSQTEAIRSQKKIIAGELAVLQAQLAEADNLLGKCRVVSPVSGTILEKYADQGELISPGKALYKVANLDEMELRVYVSGSQLSSIAIGDSVDVQIDGPDKTIQSIKGTIAWISSQAEFTPKIIQTREERVNLVYAVKIRVKNDGRLKIGMPGEVSWHKAP